MRAARSEPAASARWTAAADVPAVDRQAHRAHRAHQVHRDPQVHLVLRDPAAAARLRGLPARLDGAADPPVAGAAASQVARPVVAAW